MKIIEINTAENSYLILTENKFIYISKIPLQTKSQIDNLLSEISKIKLIEIRKIALFSMEFAADSFTYVGEFE